MDKHIHNWASFLPWPILIFFLELFLHSSPIAYWISTYLGSSSFSVIVLTFSYFSWDSAEVVCHSLLTTFGHKFPPWPIRLGTLTLKGLRLWDMSLGQLPNVSVVQFLSLKSSNNRTNHIK